MLKGNYRVGGRFFGIVYNGLLKDAPLQVLASLRQTNPELFDADAEQGAPHEQGAPQDAEDDTDTQDTDQNTA